MTSMNRRAFVQAMLAAGLGAAGIRRHAENTPSTLRIGYQKSSTLITPLKTRGTLEQSLAPLDLRVSWHEFASGLPLTEALNVGAIDFSADVADTVTVFAQAAHARFVYVAQEAPSPKAQAVIVKTGSTLRTLADLRAKRIAVTKAAGSHYLLLAALARAKLAPTNTAIHYLTPADGRAAFERGSVDAWITWDPYVASVDSNPDVRILADGNGLASY
jgi:sulfonate transport system substrate-binding protein